MIIARRVIPDLFGAGAGLILQRKISETDLVEPPAGDKNVCIQSLLLQGVGQAGGVLRIAEGSGLDGVAQAGKNLLFSDLPLRRRKRG